RHASQIPRDQHQGVVRTTAVAGEDQVGRPLRPDGAGQVLGKTTADPVRGDDQRIPRMHGENPGLQGRQVAPYDATAEHERLGRPGKCRGGDAPLDEPRGHRSHFFTVTIVPRPTAETMSNSSVSRLTPGRPRPSPPEVEKPLCSAWATLGIPGPSSRATTMIP